LNPAPTPISRAPWREYALLALLALLWGSSYTWIKIGLESLPPVTFMASRVLLGSVLLFGMMRARGLAFPRSRALWEALILQSILNCSLAWLLLAWGQQFIPSGTAGVLNSTSPLFVVVLTLFINKKFVWRDVAGALIGFAGVVLVIGPAAISATSSAEAWAYGAVLFGAFLYACAALNGKRLNSLHPLVTATGTMLCAAVVLLPIALFDKPWTLAPTPRSLGAAVMSGVFSTAIAMTIYFRLVRTLGSLGVASQAYLRAGFSVLLGVMLLGERPSVFVLGGLALVVAGVVLINWPKRSGVNA
jgi:drug/metabolite transporter (DMT)-like permease